MTSSNHLSKDIHKSKNHINKKINLNAKKYTNKSIGRASSLDSESQPSKRGVFGVFRRLFCFTKSRGDDTAENPNFSGDIIEEVSWIGTTFCAITNSLLSPFLESDNTILFFPKSVQDFVDDALVYRSWASAPGLRYLLFEARVRLLCFGVFDSLSLGDTFPMIYPFLFKWNKNLHFNYHSSINNLSSPKLQIIR